MSARVKVKRPLLRWGGLGARFACALAQRTREDRRSFTEAFRLIGIRKMGSFWEIARIVGMAA